MYANVSAPLLVRHRNAPRPTCSAARAGPAVRARTPQRRRRSDGVEQCALAAPPPAAAAAAALPLRVRAASTVCAFATLSALTLGLPEAAVAAVHTEPSNALSLPTWFIHVASVTEWMVAMDLVWRYGDATGRHEWKGLTWGMLPLHASSLCACTYHVFYNAPSLSLMVAAQAALTCFGNATLCIGAWRVASRYADLPPAELTQVLSDSDAAFLAKTAVGSLALAAAIKYGSLLIDAPFEPSLPLALSIVALGTAATAGVFAARSAAESAAPQ